MKPRRIRVIGGRMRGRVVDLSKQPESVRPTPDRVRETLFNWLGHRVVGARCLDAFAGSGVLGLEALSRGAKEVVFTEQDPRVLALLKAVLVGWQLEDCARVYPNTMPPRAGSMSFEGPFDLLFLDPPYDSGLLLPTWEALLAQGYLSDNALVVVESAANSPSLAPPSWEPIKTMTAGQVRLVLWERQTTA